MLDSVIRACLTYPFLVRTSPRSLGSALLRTTALKLYLLLSLINSHISMSK